MTRHVLRWFVLGLALFGLPVVTAQATVSPWSPAGYMASARVAHTATLLSSGKVLVAAGATTNSSAEQLYDPATNSWSDAGWMSTSRNGATATLLASGKVLVAGGFNGSFLASAELYDPATNSWSAAGAMLTARDSFTATLLASGKVLIVGGSNSSPNNLNSAELYDPATNSWSSAGTMSTERCEHTATLLSSGKVLVAGGQSDTGAQSTAELYDPAANTWSAAGAMAAVRFQHTATLLSSGKVLVVGGSGLGGALNSAELYDPATNTWSAAGTMTTERNYHSATLLASGQVLAAGGENDSSIDHSLNSAELYDPPTNTWFAAGTMTTERYGHSATLLPSGQVLVAGGTNDRPLPAGLSPYLNSAELFDPTKPLGFVSLTPVRLLDTRQGYTTVDGQFAGIGATAAGGTVDLTVAGRGRVPAGAVAVALNVTVTNPTASGYITAWPSGTPQPLASNLNFVPGETIPNLVIVKLGANGKVSLYNSAGTTHLIADVEGYFGAGTDLNALSPARILDTRLGASTIDGQFEGMGAVSAGGTLNLTIAARDGIPASGVGAAILNITAVQPTAPGYLTLWPSDAARPWASNLNFMPGDVIPNLVISGVSASGEVSIFNSAGNTNMIADLAGWFPSSSQLTPLVPARLMDTRPGASTIDGTSAGNGALQSNGSTVLYVNRGGVPASGVGAVVLNVTVTGPTAPGYLTVWPHGVTRPLASNLNFVANQTIANLVIAKVDGGGYYKNSGVLDIYNGSAGTSQVVVDVVGWFPKP